MKSHCKKLATLLGVLLAATCLTGIVSAQEMTTSTTMIEGDIMMLNEVGGVLRASDDGIVVDMVMPSDQRPEEYRSLDLRKGDIIKMVNGKRVKSTEDLTKIYEDCAIGEQIKLGIKRGQGLQIVKFPKADPADSPQVMMMTSFEGNPDDMASGGHMQTMTIGGEGDASGLASLVGLGMLPNEDNGKVGVGQVLPFITDVIPENAPEVGDIIQELQGKKITSIKEMADIWEGIKIGDEVTLSIMRKGETIKAVFVKPEGGPIMYKQDK